MTLNSEADIIGAKVRVDQTEGLDLFDAARKPETKAAPPPPPRRRAPKVSAAPEPQDADRAFAIAKIKECAFDELLARARTRRDRQQMPGVTADDIVQLAQHLPYAALLGDRQRAWSWVGPWLAAIARDGKLSEFVLGGQVVRRRSMRKESHGNLQIVYLDPTDLRAGRRAA